MRTTTSVGVNDNLPTRQACVAMRTTNHKLSRWVDMISDALFEQSTHLLVTNLGNDTWNQDVDDILLDACQHLLVSLFLCESILGIRHDELVMLGAHHNGMDALRLVIIAILNGHLTLGIRTQISHLLPIGTSVSHHLCFSSDVSQHTQDAM